MESERSTFNVANPGDAKRAPDPSATIPQNDGLAALPAVSPASPALDVSAVPVVSSAEPPVDAAVTLTPVAQDSRPPLTRLVPFADPFAGFAGHSFWLLCRLVDRVGGMKPQSAPAELAAQSLLSSPATSHMSQWRACSLGAVCCTIAAACLIPVFYASTVKAILPIPFLLIIVLVAFRFGRAAGVLGTIAAALLFAAFLYEPRGLGVSDPAARSHLMWMLIIGIVMSDLLTRFKMSRMGGHKF